MRIKNKRSQEEITEELIFIILNVVFFCVMLFFIIRSAGAEAVVEETYAKKIALIVDSMKSGTEVRINLNYLFELAKKNKYYGSIVNFNGFEANKITVKVREKGGYDFAYFSELKSGQAEIPENSKILVIKK
jgi:hypothetical protein